jgi:hypothetical protein
VEYTEETKVQNTIGTKSENTVLRTFTTIKVETKLKTALVTRVVNRGATGV